MSYKKTRGFLSLSFSVMIILTVLLTACAKATPPAPPASPTATAEAEGKNLYAQKCASCHGPNGEGTTVGPAVAGHSMLATMTQMRNPMGMMPAFPPGQLSDHETEEIAEFIASLGKAKASLLEWEKASNETMHHWMALLAIKSDDTEDAEHHLQRALLYIKEPMHKTETEKALTLIAQGNMHDAEHEIEEMAGDESPSGVTIKRFHLLLAQRANEAEDAARVKHHLDHFTIKASDAERKLAQEALELVEKGDFHEAEHEIEELLNM